MGDCGRLSNLIAVPAALQLALASLRCLIAVVVGRSF
jgi:hypothetical protein